MVERRWPTPSAGWSPGAYQWVAVTSSNAVSRLSPPSAAAPCPPPSVGGGGRGHRPAP